MRYLRAFSLALLCLVAPLCHARDLAVIVNKDNAISKLTATELEQMLTAATPSWPDGKKVRIFLTDPRSADTRSILPRIYKLKADEIKSLVDSHKAEIQVVGSDEIILTMVEQNPGSVGIVNVYSINSHVKVVKIEDKLPMEQGYLLHGN